MKFELTPVVFAVLQLLNSADAEFDEAHTRELAVALGGLDDRFGATALKGTQLGGLGNMGYSRTIGDIGGLGSNLGKMGYTRAGMGGNTRLGGLGLARPYSSNIGYGNNLLSNTLGSNLRYNNMGTSGLDLGVAAQRAQPIRSNIGYSNFGTSGLGVAQPIKRNIGYNTNLGSNLRWNAMGNTGLGLSRPIRQPNMILDNNFGSSNLVGYNTMGTTGLAGVAQQAQPIKRNMILDSNLGYSTLDTTGLGVTGLGVAAQAQPIKVGTVGTTGLGYSTMDTTGLGLGVAAQRAQPIRSNIGYSNLGTNFGNRVGYNTMGTTGLGVVRPLTRTIGSTGLGRASRTGLGNIGYGRGIGSSNIGTIGYGNNLGRVGTIGNTRTGLVGYGKGGRVGRAWGNPAHGGYNVYGPGYSSTSSHQKTGYSTGTNTGNPQLTNLGY